MKRLPDTKAEAEAEAAAEAVTKEAENLQAVLLEETEISADDTKSNFK